MVKSPKKLAKTLTTFSDGLYSTIALKFNYLKFYRLLKQTIFTQTRTNKSGEAGVR